MGKRIYGVDGKGIGVGWVVVNAKWKSVTNGRFRVPVMSTCRHNGLIIHYKAETNVYQQWKQYQVSTANLEPTNGTISPTVNLHGQQKVPWKSRAVDILANGDNEHA